MVWGSISTRKFDPKTDLVDLKGKVIVVTGGNRGIGYATVQHLARAGAKVYIAARSQERAAAAIAKILEVEGLASGSVVWHKLDLSDPRDAKKSAEEFMRLEDRLDILINNAAVIGGAYEKTSDGISTMATVNYISPFVFTRTLLPLLTATAQQPNSDVRIVNVSSMTQKFQPSSVRFKTPEDFNVTYRTSLLPGLMRYGHSKLCNLLHAKSLQNRFNAAEPPIPITVISLHPGGVNSFTDTWLFPRFSKWLVELAIQDLEHGAYNSVFAAASKEVAENREKYKGVYLDSNPTGSIATHKSGPLSDGALAEELWKTTEKFLTDIGL